MNIGYARTSTTDQAAGLAAQERDLTAAGAERFFGEQVSSVAKRMKLAECLAFLRDGDVLTVTQQTGWHAAPPSCSPSRLTCRSAESAW
jgi:DNA invertase Pin-like site-specific DNA recombinase